MGKQAGSNDLWGTGSCYVFGFTQFLEISGAALWDQRERVCSSSRAHIARGCPCVSLCDASPCLHLRGAFLILGTQRERAPDSLPSATLDSARPAVAHSLVQINPGKASWCQVPGKETGFSIQTQPLQVESGLQRIPRGFRPWICRCCFLSFSLFGGRCICPCPIQEALCLQECEGACDSLGRRLSPQRSPTAGPP